MTSDQAAEILGAVLGGSGHGHAEAIWAADRLGVPITEDQAWDVDCWIYRAVKDGREWRWSEAERCLDRAYAALGAENTHTGAAWHYGDHPVQVVAAE